MIINLFSNGTLITPDLADFLRDVTPFQVEITVYGRTRETYEAVTRVPGSYERCLRGIDLLMARRIPLALKTVVMTINAHELWDLKTWAEGLGVVILRGRVWSRKGLPSRSITHSISWGQP